MAQRLLPAEVARAYRLRERNRSSKYLEDVIRNYEKGVK